MPPIRNDWAKVLAPEYEKPYYKKLFDFVGKEYGTQTVYPPGDDIFNAFHLTPLKNIKCVIIGQDPYHGDGQAHGLSFSVSLKNIYKELHDDLGCYIPNNGYLVKWAEQGVLMLNAVLTVRAHKPASHQGKGWEEFTDAAIRAVNNLNQPVVFLLWGNFAKKKAEMLDNPNHLILTAPHPSPYSASSGFFGCKHFSQANDFLQKHGVEPIDWQIENI